MCKNNHVFETNLQVILGNYVVHCHKCGYTTTIDKMDAIFLRDEFFPSGETFHIFYLYPNLFCQSCGNRQDTFSMICYTKEEAVINYESYKTAKPIEKGIIQ